MKISSGADILAPGLDYPANYLIHNCELKNKRVLVIGSGCELPALRLFEHSENMVDLIVEDYDSLINSQLNLEDHHGVRVRIMDFEITDFGKDEIDVVLAQNSLTDFRRSKILKEIKRILKPGGFISAGELVKMQEKVPVFVEDMFRSSLLDPLTPNEAEKFYTDRSLKIIEKYDLSFTLRKYYTVVLNKLKETLGILSEREKKYYKKLIKKISHESNIYLKQGGDKYIGFRNYLMKYDA